MIFWPWREILVAAWLASLSVASVSPRRPRNAMNVSVVALRPYNQTVDVADKDTADIAGDVFFYLADRALTPYACRHSNNSEFFCKGGQAKLVDPSDVYTWQLIEVDATFGGCPSGEMNCSAYADCNPHVLKNGSLGWYCACDMWWNPHPCNVTGKLAVESRYCGHMARATDAAPTCQLCSDGCQGIWSHWKSYISALTRGTWYSTPKEGSCETAEGACAWRVVNTFKTINATCANDHLHFAIERRARSNAQALSAPSCFDACEQPKNRTSDCYILCLVQTVLGRKPLSPNASHVISQPMRRSELVAPLQQALLLDDPEEGGCPSLPPYVPPLAHLQDTAASAFVV